MPDPSTPAYTLRLGVPSDCESMVALLPRLAAFDLPAGRAPEELYQADAQTVRHWSVGEEPSCFAFVAELTSDGRDAETRSIVGFSFVRMREEMLSGAPSAHLEVLVVGESAQGKGVGGALLDTAFDEARRRGARSITLHVFANNTRARSLYERRGFDGELLRMIKRFDCEP